MLSQEMKFGEILELLSKKRRRWNSRITGDPMTSRNKKILEALKGPATKAGPGDRMLTQPLEFFISKLVGPIGLEPMTNPL